MFYHLAYCLGEAREIEQGVKAVQTALELDQENVQLWHLLALLLTASKDWEGAAKACEAGIRVWEEDEEDSAEEIEESGLSGNPTDGEPNVGSKDFASSPLTVTLPAENAPSEPLVLPSGSIRAHQPTTQPAPTRSKKLENVIRLRITQKVIIEQTQGPETAMEEAEDLFAFFSNRSGNKRAQFGYRKGLNQGLGESMASVRDLGGSYISVADLHTGPRGSVVSSKSWILTTKRVTRKLMNPSTNAYTEQRGGGRRTWSNWSTIQQLFTRRITRPFRDW